jgi:putative membrane protein
MTAMGLAAALVVVFVALQHVAFLVLEMFFWSKPLGRRVFGLPPDVMASSAALAANQGLYNGFLAAGLFWGVLQGPAGLPIKVFFLGCVVIAAVFGAFTAKRSILWVQGLPATLGLLLVFLSRP